MSDIFLTESFARNPVDGSDTFNNTSLIGWSSTTNSNRFDISTTQQRNGLACLGKNIGSTVARATRNFNSPKTVACIGFAYKVNFKSATISSRPFAMGFVDSNNDRYTVGMDAASNALNLYINNTILASSPLFYSLGVYNYVELRRNSATGLNDVWINKTKGAAPDFSFTSGAPNALVGIVATNTSTNGGGAIYFDDVYASDGTQYGDTVVDTKFPVADGLNQDWTPSIAGPTFQMVNNAPVIAGQFIETATINDFSDFDIANPTPVVFDAHGVSVEMRAVRSGASIEEFRMSLSDGVNTIFSPAFIAPQTAPGLFQYCFPTAPDGGSWTPAKLAGLIAGVEKTT